MILQAKHITKLMFISQYVIEKFNGNYQRHFFVVFLAFLLFVVMSAFKCHSVIINNKEYFVCHLILFYDITCCTLLLLKNYDSMINDIVNFARNIGQFLFPN